jgi:hypothetical protein
LLPGHDCHKPQPRSVFMVIGAKFPVFTLILCCNAF